MRAVSVGLVVVLAFGVIHAWNIWHTPEEIQPSAEPSSQTENSTMAGTAPISDVSDAETDITNPYGVVETSQNTDLEVLYPPVDTQALPVEETAANINRNVVEIPAGGYPVEDSMKYFVPRHERTLGNLGGPPPPPFMVPENAQGERRIEPLLPPAPNTPGQ